MDRALNFIETNEANGNATSVKRLREANFKVLMLEARALKWFRSVRETKGGQAGASVCVCVSSTQCPVTRMCVASMCWFCADNFVNKTITPGKVAHACLHMQCPG